LTLTVQRRRSEYLVDASLQRPNPILYVDGANGADTNDGILIRAAKATLQGAVDAASAGDIIHVLPVAAGYDEEVTVPFAKTGLTFVGLGGRGGVFVEPSATNATGLTNEANDTTFINVGIAGAGTGHAVANRGRRLRLTSCKVEGGTDGLRLTSGTAAQVAAGTHNDGSDTWFKDCEFAYNTNGVNLVGTDQGAITQPRFQDCLFHDNTNDFVDTVGSGASASILWRDLDISRCRFRRAEDGTEPTMYLDLDRDNGNKGVAADNELPTALAGGKNLVSTGLIWVSNKHTDGISGAQPS
jgi:hypothetical protein